MILMTMIARVADGLPLAASIQEDEQVFRPFLLLQTRFVYFMTFLIILHLTLFYVISRP